MVTACLLCFVLGFLAHKTLVAPRQTLQAVRWLIARVLEFALLNAFFHAYYWGLVWLDEVNRQNRLHIDELYAWYLDLCLRLASVVLSVLE